MRSAEHDPLADPAIEPLTEREETVWRAFARAIIAVPRALDADLIAGQGMTNAEYFVLVNLSEATDRRLQMTQLAQRGSLSPSRISRLVDDLVRRGWVQRTKGAADGRISYAVLTDAGFTRLQAAYPTHLLSVRRNVVDHLQGLDLVALADAVAQFAGGQSLDVMPCEEGAIALEAERTKPAASEG